MESVIKDLKISLPPFCNFTPEEWLTKGHEYDACIILDVDDIEWPNRLSGNIEEELMCAERAIKLLGGRLENVVHFQLAGTDNSRSFVLIRKEKPTPKAYPRKPGTAKREPL